jgi:flagellar basal-body rod protein FlgF
MDRMLYVAMTGARQTMQSQAMTANNLANISTRGFRADLAAMRSMPLFGDGLPSRVFSMTERAGIDFNHGTIDTTDRQLDVALQGDGFFVVQSRDGSEAYTRAGDFNVSSAGILQTSNGLPVMGENGPISIPESKNILFGTDGTISIRPNDANANEITQIDRLKLVKPPLNNLQKGADGLFRLQDGRNAIEDPNIKVVSGALETSNVNAATELVNMIEHARQFEMQTKMMKIADENEQRTAQIMQLS